MKNLQNQVNLLERKSQLSERNEVENNQYSRKNSVRIFNLPAPTGTNEDHRRVVCDFVNTKLKVEPPLVPNDIDVAHRVGGRTPRNTQTMLVKFVRRYDKFRVLKLRKELSGSKMGISDDIAKQYLDFMETLKNRADISQTWFFNGKVFCKPVGTDHNFTPRLHCDISRLIKETLDKPPRQR